MIYMKFPKPPAERSAMVFITVTVPPAASSPSFPVSSAPSDASTLKTMKKLNPNDRPSDLKKPSLTCPSP